MRDITEYPAQIVIFMLAQVKDLSLLRWTRVIENGCFWFACSATLGKLLRDGVERVWAFRARRCRELTEPRETHLGRNCTSSSNSLAVKGLSK